MKDVAKVTLVGAMLLLAMTVSADAVQRLVLMENQTNTS